MTDRVNALIVVLEKDMRDDDVEVISNAIRMLRGVLRVDNNISDASDYVAQARVANKVRESLIELANSL